MPLKNLVDASADAHERSLNAETPPTPLTASLVCLCRSRLMSSMEDLLFYTITEGQDMVPLPHFISVSDNTHCSGPPPVPPLMNT